MDTTVNIPERTIFSAAPKRILVQTKTHLVPGKDFHDKLMFMLDLICQHHWHRDYDFDQDRWSTHGCRFGYPNRTCYFLLDSGVSTNDDDIKVLRYRFTGIEEPLIAIPGPPPLEMQIELRKYPFTRPLFKDLPKKAPLDATARCRSIQSKLRSDMNPSESDFEFLKKNLEAMEWLKGHIELRFWLKFESLANARREDENEKRKGRGDRQRNIEVLPSRSSTK